MAERPDDASSGYKIVDSSEASGRSSQIFNAVVTEGGTTMKAIKMLNQANGDISVASFLSQESH